MTTDLSTSDGVDLVETVLTGSPQPVDGPFTSLYDLTDAQVRLMCRVMLDEARGKPKHRIVFDRVHVGWVTVLADGRFLAEKVEVNDPAPNWSKMEFNKPTYRTWAQACNAILETYTGVPDPTGRWQQADHGKLD